MPKKIFFVQSMLSMPNSKINQIINKIADANNCEPFTIWYDHLSSLPLEDWRPIFDKVGPLIIDSINSIEDLAQLFKLFSPVEWPKIFSTLTPAIDHLIISSRDVDSILFDLEENTRFTFFNLLDEHLKKERLIALFNSNSRDDNCYLFERIIGLLKLMPEYTQKLVMIAYFKSIIEREMTDYHKLAMMLNVLPESEHSDFIVNFTPSISKQNGQHYFHELLKDRPLPIQTALLQIAMPSFSLHMHNSEDLIKLLSVVPEFKQQEILLNINQLVPLLKNGSELGQLLSVLSKENQSLVLSLTRPSMDQIIHHKLEELCPVLKALPEHLQTDLLLTLSDLIISMLPSGNPLGWFLRNLSVANKTTIIQIIRPRLKSIITNGSELAYILGSLTEDQKDIVMLEMNDVIPELVKTYESLVSMLKEMNSLNKKATLLLQLSFSLESMITYPYSLLKVLEILPDTLTWYFIHLSKAMRFFGMGETELIEMVDMHVKGFKDLFDPTKLLMSLLTAYHDHPEINFLNLVRHIKAESVNVQVINMLETILLVYGDGTICPPPKAANVYEAAIFGMQTLMLHPASHCPDIDLSELNIKAKAAPYIMLSRAIFDPNYLAEKFRDHDTQLNDFIKAREYINHVHREHEEEHQHEKNVIETYFTFHAIKNLTAEKISNNRPQLPYISAIINQQKKTSTNAKLPDTPTTKSETKLHTPPPH